ncbi:hypothetical protein F750_3021 [Streptomyces sp. PAMC 26508]|nr:hypothetical protein F750_3021 [Streptomyces sp. PAMC 26508]
MEGRLPPGRSGGNLGRPRSPALLVTAVEGRAGRARVVCSWFRMEGAL